MSNNEKKETFTKEMEEFKVRMYTNIPPNCVLVATNIFTKKSKIYSKAMFHMPWMQSRFISLETQHIDLAKKPFETEGGQLTVCVDAAVTYKIKPFLNENGKKYGVIDRLKAFKNSFKKRPLSAGFKALATLAVTIASGVVLSPILFAVIPAIAAGYVTLVYQDPETVKEQSAYKAVYNSAAAQTKLEHNVYDGLRSYYTSNSYDDVRGKTVDLNSPEFAVLKQKIEEVKNDFGIEVSGVNIINVDLSEDSNRVLREKKEKEVAREARKLEAEVEAEARKKEAEGLNAIIETLKAQGLTPSEIASYLRAEALAKGGNGTVIVSDSGANIATAAAVGEATRKKK